VPAVVPPPPPHAAALAAAATALRSCARASSSAPTRLPAPAAPQVPAIPVMVLSLVYHNVARGQPLLARLRPEETSDRNAPP